jgi:hypothetical protein
VCWGGGRGGHVWGRWRTCKLYNTAQSVGGSEIIKQGLKEPLHQTLAYSMCKRLQTSAPGFFPSRMFKIYHEYSFIQKRGTGRNHVSLFPHWSKRTMNYWWMVKHLDSFLWHRSFKELTITSTIVCIVIFEKI